MRNSKKEQLDNYTAKYSKVCLEKNGIDTGIYESYGVKRGLRDKNGEGVVAGLTNISLIKSQEVVDGKRMPCEGRLLYRGYDVIDLVKGFEYSKRFGFEEIAYLLLFGSLPNGNELMEDRKSVV